jgi:iron complex outermembrane receptor protein
MIRIIMIAGIFMFAVNYVQGQSLSGTVIDKTTQQPLPGVSIIIPDLKTGAITDINGNYKIEKLPVGRFLVQPKLIGYSGAAQNITISFNSTLNFELSPRVIEKSEVVITGSAFTSDNKRMSLPVTPIDRLAITNLAPDNLIQALTTIPGVAAITTGNGIAKPVIRGLSYNRVVVINQGVRQEGQQWGDEHGPEIDQFAADNIEVLKGPSSLQFGSDALGGVINILEPIPAPEGVVRGEFNTQYNTNNKLTGNSLMLEGNSSGFIWRIRGSYKNAAAFKTPVETVYNSGFNENAQHVLVGFNKRWGYSHFHASRWSSNLGLTEGDRDSITGALVDGDGNPVSPSILNSRKLSLPQQQIEHLKVSTSNNFLLGKGQLRFTAGWQQNDRKELEESYEITGIHMQLRTGTYDIKYYPTIFGKWETALGLSGMLQENTNSGEEYLIPNYNLKDAGAFATAKLNLENTTFNVGIRYDQRKITMEGLTEDSLLIFVADDKTFSSPTGSIGFTHAFSESITIKSNIGRGYRAPSISELSANGVHEGTFRYEIGNLNLKAENSLQFDLGLEIEEESFSAGTNLFFNSIDNFIYYKNENQETIIYSGDIYPVYRYVQGNARLYGGELSFDFHLVEELHFENTIAMVVGKNSSSGEWLPFIPPFRTTHELRYDKANKNSSRFTDTFFKIGIDNNLRQNRIDSFETENNPYVLLNAGAGTVFKLNKVTIRLFANFNNILNTKYFNHLSRYKEIGVSGMGRNVSFGMEIPFSSSN